MKIVAVTTEQMLELVLFRVHASGWVKAEIEKLVDVCLAFSLRTRRCVYKQRSGPDLRDRLRACIETDIAALVAKGYAQRTVGCVMLTSKGVQQAYYLKPEQALYGSLLPVTSTVFPPRPVPLTAARP